MGLELESGSPSESGKERGGFPLVFEARLPRIPPLCASHTQRVCQSLQEGPSIGSLVASVAFEADPISSHLSSPIWLSSLSPPHFLLFHAASCRTMHVGLCVRACV